LEDQDDSDITTENEGDFCFENDIKVLEFISESEKEL
jgi:hypothetical protein